MAVDQGLVLGSGQITIVVCNTCEAVYRVDIAGVQQVSNPQINVEVGGLGSFSFASVLDGKVFVDVRVQIELPGQAAAVD